MFGFLHTTRRMHAFIFDKAHIVLRRLLGYVVRRNVRFIYVRISTYDTQDACSSE